MDNLKPAQTPIPNQQNPVSIQTNSLPTLPVSNNSQVFIHPEHEQGSLVIPKNPQRIKNRFLPLTLTISIVGLLSIAALIFGYFIPRSQAVSYAKSVREFVTESSEKLDKVNSSLDILYKARTAQKEDVSVTKVLEASTSKDSSEINIFRNAQRVIAEIKQNFEKNSKVKGYTLPSDDPAFEIRQHRELARDIAKKTLEAEITLEKIADLEKQSIPQTANAVKEKISNLEEGSNNYVDQAKKSSEYYIDVSDASIELLSLANSINTPKDLDITISKFSALKSKFSNYQNLPEEIEAYNSDLIEVFDLSATYISQIREVVNSGYVKPMPSSQLFNSQLQSISSRAVDDEISFWQNNESLSSYDDLSKEHTDILESSQKLKDKNYFFFLKWLGVD